MVIIVCIYVLCFFLIFKCGVVMCGDDEDEDEDDEIFFEFMLKGDLMMVVLCVYDGSDFVKLILFVVKGIVFDVMCGRDFYGKGGLYNVFIGIDCSRALGKVSLEKENLCVDVGDFVVSE